LLPPGNIGVASPQQIYAKRNEFGRKLSLSRDRGAPARGLHTVGFAKCMKRSACFSGKAA
jgi:hypothetical protein